MRAALASSRAARTGSVSALALFVFGVRPDVVMIIEEEEALSSHPSSSSSSSYPETEEGVRVDGGDSLHRLRLLDGVKGTARSSMVTIWLVDAIIVFFSKGWKRFGGSN